MEPVNYPALAHKIHRLATMIGLILPHVESAMRSLPGKDLSVSWVPDQGQAFDNEKSWAYQIHAQILFLMRVFGIVAYYVYDAKDPAQILRAMQKADGIDLANDVRITRQAFDNWKNGHPLIVANIAPLIPQWEAMIKELDQIVAPPADESDDLSIITVDPAVLAQHVKQAQEQAEASKGKSKSKAESPVAPPAGDSPVSDSPVTITPAVPETVQEASQGPQTPVPPADKNDSPVAPPAVPQKQESPVTVPATQAIRNRVAQK